MAIDVWGLSYKLFGEIARKHKSFYKGLYSSMLKARIKISLEAYISFLIMALSITLIASYIISFIYIYYFLNYILIASILLSTAITIFSASIVFGSIYAYPYLKASMFGSRVNDELPYAIAHMSVLAIAGATPENIFRSVASVPNDPVADFMKDIVRDIDLFGYDIITAVRNARERSPSKILDGFLGEMEAIISSGGDLKEFLASYNKELLTVKTIEAKKLSEMLSTLAEVFLILMVVLPLLMITMLSIMSLVGGTVLGLNIIQMMQLIAYIMVPFMGIFFLVVLDQVIPRGGE